MADDVRRSHVVVGHPRSLRRPGLPLLAASAATVFAGWSVWLGSRDNIHPWWVFAILESIGLSFVAAGTWLWVRGRAGRLGPLMVLGGACWYLGNLQSGDVPVLYAVGYWLYYVSLPIFGHVVLAYPTGQLRGRIERVVVAGGYLSYLGLQAARYLAEGDRGAIGLQVPQPDSGWADALSATAFAITSGTLALLYVRRPRTAAGRRPHALVWAVLGVVGTVLLAHTVASVLDAPVALQTGLFLAYGTGLVCLPFAFAFGAFRVSWMRGVVADIIGELDRRPDQRGVRDLLATALRDPELQLGLWSNTQKRYLDERGRELPRPVSRAHRRVRGVEWQRQPLAYLDVDKALDDHPGLMDALTAAIRLSLVRARQLADIQASRARVVQAVLEERNRIARGLHDTMQYRLYGVAQLAQSLRHLAEQSQLPSEAVGMLARLEEAARESTQALRDVAQDIYPAILRERGLAAAVEEMAYRVSLPLESDLPSQRFSPTVEAAVYFAIGEVVANVLKHAHASHVVVMGTLSRGILKVEIVDDGIGGAYVRHGGGLATLSDRLAALDGSLTVRSTDEGTIIRMDVPCEW